MLKRFSINLTQRNEPYLRVYVDTKANTLKVYHSEKSWLFNGTFDDFDEYPNQDVKELVNDEIGKRIPACLHPNYKTSTGVNCHGECEFCNYNPWKNN
jgi:hypothetical protein